MKKIPGLMFSLVNSFKHLSKTVEILHKVFQKIEEAGIFPKSFYKNSIALILKPDKDITRKENNRLTSLANIDTKFLDQNFSKLNPAIYKRIIYHGQGGFNPEMQGQFNIKIKQ